MSSTQTVKNFVSRTVASIMQNKPTREGNGVIVNRSLSPQNYFSPFALLDFATIAAGAKAAGSGFPPHPHAGISTLSYMLPSDDGHDNQGGFEHMDHLGNHGLIRPGGLQFMVAGKGLIHSEMPMNQEETKGLQLWINLAKKDKKCDPFYQEYDAKDVPIGFHTPEDDDKAENVMKNCGQIKARVVMGEALGIKSPVQAVTPVHYIHYTLGPNATLNHPLPKNWNTFMFAFSGSGQLGSEKSRIIPKHTAIFETPDKDTPFVGNPDPIIDSGYGVTIISEEHGLDFVLVSGEPLPKDEGYVPHGPMIATSRQELIEQFEDYQNDRNGFAGARAFIDNWKP